MEVIAHENEAEQSAALGKKHTAIKNRNDVREALGDRC